MLLLLCARPSEGGGEGEEEEQKEGEEVVGLEESEELQGPAPDIWAWGLQAGRYLPHIRRRNRLYLQQASTEVVLF